MEILLSGFTYMCISYIVTLVSFFFTTGTSLSDNKSYVLGLILGLLWPLTLLVTTIALVRKLVYDMLNKFKS